MDRHTRIYLIQTAKAWGGYLLIAGAIGLAGWAVRYASGTP